MSVESGNMVVVNGWLPPHIPFIGSAGKGGETPSCHIHKRAGMRGLTEVYE